MSLASPHAKGNYIVAVHKSIIGTKVVNPAKEDLGKIEDVIIDTRGNRIAYAILSFGGFLGMGDKHFAMPWQAIDFQAAENCAVLNIDKERLKNAPGFDNDNWPDMADPKWDKQLCSHYGYESYLEKKN
jgi:sporulation protein YlmC with PRC-barrel domain